MKTCVLCKEKYFRGISRSFFKATEQESQALVQVIKKIILRQNVLCEDFLKTPVYKYRYETEDVMKSAASNVPVRGYQVIEGGYYPSEIDGGSFGGFGNVEGRGGKFIGAATGYNGQFLSPHQVFQPSIGPQFSGQINSGYNNGHFLGGGGAGLGLGGTAVGLGGIQHHYPQYIGGNSPVGFGGIHHQYPHHIGGEEFSKEAFSGAKKNVNDEKFEKSEGKKGEEINHGKTGYSKGEASAKDIKGDSGFYSNTDGEKKVIEDGKEYNGGQHYNKEGKSGEEQTAKKGHKKGHKVKSFKTSHHKDESGKSEEYYDEDHDEGGNYAFNGQTGSFGENGAQSFKGGKEDSKFNAVEAKNEGHFKNEHSVDKAEGDQGKYGENKHAGNEATFGYKNGADEQSLLGHQESNKFFKSHPYVIPFYQP